MHLWRLTKRVALSMVILAIAGAIIRNYRNRDVHLQTRWTYTKPKAMSGLGNDTVASKRPGVPILLWWDSVYTSVDEVKSCGQSECRVVNNRSLQGHPDTAAFIFYGSHFKPYSLPFPRKRHHLWALMHEESPRNAYILSHGSTLDIFNFTSSYKRHSDYPITTQWLKCADWIYDKKYVLQLVDKNRLRRSGLAPILYLHSDCDVPSDRDSFVRMLQNYIPVDSYGLCVNNKKLPDRLRFHNDMSPLEDDHFYQFVARYKFTLTMENYVCDDYVTEKLWRPLRLGSVPIVFGAPNIRKYLPSNKSAILVEDFQDVEDLANYIKLLDTNNKLYKQYLTFKDNPLENKDLLNILNTRDWRPDICDKPHRKSKQSYSNNKYSSIFVGFECFLCNKIAEMQRSKPEATPWHYKADYSHYQCPAPRKFDSKGRYSVHSDRWVSEWLHGKYEADVLETVYQQQRTLTQREFNKLVKQQIKNDKSV